MPIRVYKTSKGILIHNSNRFFLVQSSWDELVNQEDLYGHLQQLVANLTPLETADATEYLEQHLMAP
jgi:hypothetical protein